LQEKVIKRHWKSARFSKKNKKIRRIIIKTHNKKYRHYTISNINFKKKRNERNQKRKKKKWAYVSQG
jgi:hypothetical protein